MENLAIYYSRSGMTPEVVSSAFRVISWPKIQLVGSSYLLPTVILDEVA